MTSIGICFIISLLLANSIVRVLGWLKTIILGDLILVSYKQQCSINGAPSSSFGNALVRIKYKLNRPEAIARIECKLSASCSKPGSVNIAMTLLHFKYV